MDKTAHFGLPRDLGHGMMLRWATPDDMEALAAFNVRIHSDDPNRPQEFLASWTHDLMSGQHPTATASDFTVAVDKRKRNKIVSSIVLISQTWTYDGIEFGCGRPELVGTDPDYRRRGLVRAQFEAIHAKSAARGELVQAIAGIPWYYRRFDYELALDLHGRRDYYWRRPGNFEVIDRGIYRWRSAGPDDIPVLQELYERHSVGSLVTRRRDERSWQYELFEMHRDSPDRRHVYMVELKEGDVVGYVEYRQWDQKFVIREIAVIAGYSLRAVCLSLVQMLKRRADELNKSREKPVEYIAFSLGAAHPVYEALGEQLEKQRPPYAWYIRVPDLPVFLRHIGPVLEKRLAASVMAGHTGMLRLSFYQHQVALVFEKGKLAGVGTFNPRHFRDGDAFFPDLTFLQLLFGYRSLDELKYTWPDCYTNDVEAAVLLKILFPKQHSWVVPLG